MLSGALHMVGRRRLAVLLLPVATVAVHQLRYLLAYGPDAGRVLIAQGDDYVESVIPGLVLLLALCVGAGMLQLRRVARGSAPPRPARHTSVWRLWAIASAGLLVAYLGQESLEVVLGSAHTSVLTQAFGDGGWWAGPAAVLVGLGWAIVARGARAALALAARHATRHRWTAGRTPAPALLVLLWYWDRHPVRCRGASPVVPLPFVRCRSGSERAAW